MGCMYYRIEEADENYMHAVSLLANKAVAVKQSGYY